MIFPDAELEDAAECRAPGRAQPGDYVMVKVTYLHSSFPCAVLFSRAAAARRIRKILKLEWILPSLSVPEDL